LPEEHARRPPLRLLALLYALALVPTLALAIRQPALSRVDEAAHFDVLAQYARGVYPVLGSTEITDDTLSLMRRTGVVRWDIYLLPQPVPSRASFQELPGGISASALTVWMQRHIWQFSYEAQQPPLYYAVALPAWLLGRLLAGDLGALYATRLFDALLLALMAPLTFLLASRVAQSRRVAAAAALAAVLVPGAVLNQTQVTNDVLATVLGALAVLLAVSGVQEGWPPGRSTLLALATGGAVLSKSTAVGLLPVAGLALLLPAPSLRRLAGAGLVLAATLAPLVLLNEATYHALTPVATVRLFNTLDVEAFGASTAIGGLLNCFGTFWLGEPLLFTLRFGWPLAVLMAVAGVFAGVGIARLLLKDPQRRLGLGLVVAALVGQVAAAYAIMQLGGWGFLPPGRYVYPALAAAATLLAVGLAEEMGRYAAPVLFFLGSASAGLLLVFCFQSPEPPAGDRVPPSTSSLTQAAASASFEGVEVTIDEWAIDRSAGQTWVHVSVANQSGGPVEWAPVPDLQIQGRTVAGADYWRSTQLSERLAPGATESGWIRLRVDPTALPAGAEASLVFSKIAVDDYAQMGAASLSVRLPRS